MTKWLKCAAFLLVIVTYGSGVKGMTRDYRPRLPHASLATTIGTTQHTGRPFQRALTVSNKNTPYVLWAGPFLLRRSFPYNHQVPRAPPVLA